jgi:hypothetical protein
VAISYRDQGRWEEAEQLDVQVMETRKEMLGEDHPDTLRSMSSLALTYQNRRLRNLPLFISILIG